MYIGIICEFDPLHSGHARLLSHARAMGADAVICAMSGNFTQRGSFAALDKRARAEMAVRCGADLVVELPTVWAMSKSSFPVARVHNGTRITVRIILIIRPALLWVFFGGAGFFSGSGFVRITSGSRFLELAAYFGLYPMAVPSLT